MGAISADPREASIIRTSFVGIASNILLAAFKAAVGFLSNSIAITLDAVNNLSDALSSVITIVGTKLAGKRPDRDHPFGHGRAEYITTIVISAIILWAGVTSLVESVRRIVFPEQASYETPMLIVVAVAVAVKIALGIYFKGRGRELSSGTLVASGEDATMDAIISSATLIAAVVSLAGGPSLEAWLAAVISVIIIKTGIDILREALSKILGERVDSELAAAIKESVRSVEDVRGAYDLTLTDYGPERLMGSIHVEVDEELTARDIDRITRKIQQGVLADTGVILHTVGIYSLNSHRQKGGSDIVAEVAAELDRLVAEEPHALQTHGLYVDEDAKKMTFDVVISFEAKPREEVRDRFIAALAERFPGYEIEAVIDSDISD